MWPTPYCEWKCPVHNTFQIGWDLVSEGSILEAGELWSSTNSLPEVCGRFAHKDRLCEGACTLVKVFWVRVTHWFVEKYITDTAFALGWRPDKSNVVPVNKTRLLL